MRESDVRDALYESEIRAIMDDDPESYVVNELGVLQGDCRVDVAVINGRLHGYELKSASDTLERLPVQQEAYSKVFDRMTLVVAGKHLEKAEGMIPEWWGLIEARDDAGTTTLSCRRRAQENPEADALSLAKLLWREEVLEILIARGFRGIKSKPKYVLWDILAEHTALSDLKDLVRTTLRARGPWRAGQPQ